MEVEVNFIVLFVRYDVIAAGLRKGVTTYCPSADSSSCIC